MGHDTTVVTRRFDEFTVGQVESLERVLGADEIRRFVELTGDTNPVHLDDDYAAQVGFESGRIVNGLLTASLVATLIGTKLPGPGALELSQRFNFRAPLLLGEKIRVEGRIRQLSPAIRAMVLEIRVLNERQEVVIDGEAVVQLREPRTTAEPR